MENFTRYGKFMYNLCMSATKFLIKHRFLYYFLACTWGILMTLLSVFITFGLFITGHKTEPYYWVYFQRAGGDYWGGFETGVMFVRDRKSTESINKHEFGHTFQNCVLGPFVIFLSFIPSVTRYWYREIRERKGKQNTTGYDDIWFEKSATDCGTYAVEYFQQQEKTKQ